MGIDGSSMAPVKHQKVHTCRWACKHLKAVAPHQKTNLLPNPLASMPF